MKRIICLTLCLMLACSCAMAETADTLQKKFTRQLMGGSGIRGKLNLVAYGEADWLAALLPFTAADIQIRAIGEKQGELSVDVPDDDDWQIKLYVENSEGKEVGVSWLHGDPAGVYFQSELLPETLLLLPVEQVNLLYQLFKGEYSDLFFAFDPLDMKDTSDGNVPAYQAVADLLDIPADEWESKWLPVLEKYFLKLDLWLSSYGDPSFLTGKAGGMTMAATYTIPVEDIKKEAKYIIGQMLFDNDLLNLLTPYVTLEQRVTYLNPSMVYSYEACIDQLPLEGEAVLSREMSAMGEDVSMTVSLPLPPLPDTLIAPIGEVVAAAFELPYADLLAGMKQITFTQTGNEKTLTLTGDQRSITLTGAEFKNDDVTNIEGTLRIIPNIGVDENSLSAAYQCAYSHRIWQDENYLDHDMNTFSLAVQPDLDMLSADDPFRNSYVDFSPLNIQWTVDYSNNSYQEGSPVQVKTSISAKLPDAEISMDMVLRITSKVTMTELPISGAQNLLGMTNEQMNELFATLMNNAVRTMANLSVPTTMAEEESEPEAAATSVPPMNE